MVRKKCKLLRKGLWSLPVVLAMYLLLHTAWKLVKSKEEARRFVEELLHKPLHDYHSDVNYTYITAHKQIVDIRLDRLQQQCNKLKEYWLFTQKRSYSSIPNAYVLPKFHLIANLIPKTGRTTWQFILWNNSLPVGSNLWRNQSIVGNLWREKVLRKYGILMVQHQHDSIKFDLYFKLLTVRHPLSRLESVYLNKLLYNKYYQQTWGISILKRYRKETKENTHLFETGAEVTFEEFIKFVIDDPTHDEHYMPYSFSSHPCELNYNYIAKTETTNEDIEYFITTHLAGKGSAITMNKSTWNASNQTSDKGVYLEHFSALPHLKSYLLQLEGIYGIDMITFGYSYKIVGDKLYALCDMYTGDGKCI